MFREGAVLLSDRHVIPFPWSVSSFHTLRNSNDRGSRVVETDHHSCHNEIERSEQTNKKIKHVKMFAEIVLPSVDPRVSRQDADGAEMVKEVGIELDYDV